MPFKTKSKSVALLAAGMLAGSVTTALSATNTNTNTGPRYTARERIKIRNHHCPAEDDMLFIPAVRVNDAVRVTTRDHTYCVQIDSAHRAPHN